MTEERTTTSAQTMTGGQALVAALINEGIDTIFALPGVQLDGAFDALYDEQARIRVVHTRHEQATAYMADGYARSTGRIGTCLVVPGPGLLNAAAGLSTAYACNSPVLCITGQIQSDLIEFGRGLLHEIPNQLTMVRSVTKHAARAVTPGEIPALVRDAITELWNGRVRPVEIEVPPDTLLSRSEIEMLDAAPGRRRLAGNPDEIEEAAKLLGGAKNPLIFAGGGILGSAAREELRVLADLLQPPVAMSSNGKGAVSDRHYLAQSSVGGAELIKEADVIFAVGTRFVDPATAKWKIEPGRTVIQMDIDPEEVGRNYQVALGIVADAKVGLAALAERVGAHSGRRPSREKELTEFKDGIAAK